MKTTQKLHTEEKKCSYHFCDKPATHIIRKNNRNFSYCNFHKKLLENRKPNGKKKTPIFLMIFLILCNTSINISAVTCPSGWVPIPDYLNQSGGTCTTPEAIQKFLNPIEIKNTSLNETEIIRQEKESESLILSLMFCAFVIFILITILIIFNDKKSGGDF